MLRSKTITYNDFEFLALEVRVPTDGLSISPNWCYDYQYLCEEFGRRPTGCGQRFSSNPSYSSCRDKYNSDMNIGDVLGCNPGYTIGTVASRAFPDRTPARRYNSFGFHACSYNTCARSIKASDTSLSYMTDFWTYNATTFYTVCR